MNWGLLIIYILSFIGLLFYANRYGKPKTDYNFWAGLIATITDLVLIWWALDWRFW